MSFLVTAPPLRVAHLFPPGTRPDVFSDGLTDVAPIRRGGVIELG